MLERFVKQLLDAFKPRLPSLVVTEPICSANLRTPFAELATSLWDGLLLVPKRRRQIREIWKRRYGNDNWGTGTKLWKPKNHIVTCMECGNFHELHTICRACYLKVEEETKAVLESVKNVWRTDVIDKEIDVVYKGETSKSVGKRIVEVDRLRPLWFAPNLVQKANKLKQIDGRPKEAINLEVKIKQ